MLESKEVIEAELLSQVAKALNVPEESIKNFDEEAAINVINTTFNSHDNPTLIAYQSALTFNPIEKIVQLYDEKVALLERLLQAEKEKNELLKGSLIDHFFPFISLSKSKSAGGGDSL